MDKVVESRYYLNGGTGRPWVLASGSPVNMCDHEITDADEVP